MFKRLRTKNRALMAGTLAEVGLCTLISSISLMFSSYSISMIYMYSALPVANCVYTYDK